jgi:dTDP-4-amino-4,6-dideoxygalactose transaminase
MTDRKVPFFNYPQVFNAYENEFVEALKDIGHRGAFIMQKDLRDFEKSLAEYTGAEYAVGVANATDGLQMGLMAGGIQAGDEVIICSHTMVATAASVYFAGAVSVPIEPGKDHLMDPDNIEAAITSKTKAIMPTQLNGRTAQMDRIQEIADKHGLLVFEDAAQGLGAKYKGKNAGTFGVASCISFYPAKVIGCLGDGGAVLTNDEEVYKKLLLLRDHGRDEESGDVVCWGFNSRLDTLHAAFLNVQFKNYPKVIERRREIAALYNEKLTGVGDLVLPEAPGCNSDYFDIFQNYEIETAKRDELKAFLSENNIGTLIQWGGKGVHQFPKLGFNQSLPFTESLMKSMLMLPLNMSLTNDDVNYVCDKIKEFYVK